MEKPTDICLAHLSSLPFAAKNNTYLVDPKVISLVLTTQTGTYSAQFQQHET